MSMRGAIYVVIPSIFSVLGAQNACYRVKLPLGEAIKNVLPQILGRFFGGVFRRRVYRKCTHANEVCDDGKKEHNECSKMFLP